MYRLKKLRHTYKNVAYTYRECYYTESVCIAQQRREMPTTLTRGDGDWRSYIFSWLIWRFISVRIQWEVFNVKLFKKVPQWASSGGAAAPTAPASIRASWPVALFRHAWPTCGLEAPSSGRPSVLPGEGRATQIPQLLRAVHKHAVSNDIIEGDRAPESCPNRFPGNMNL